MNWLGLDIGGANLKVADSKGHTQNLPFPLWKHPHELAKALRELIFSAPPVDGIAVTMTGELADCFETKTQGVLHILDAVEQAAESRRIVVYQVDGRFVLLSAARAEPLLAAASNWHALARFACRCMDRFPAVLLDVGSTTTDIIPIDANGPITSSTSDTNRILNGELVYTGISRTAIAAVTPFFPYRGHLCPVASELFATTADSAILLGYLPEQPQECDTADGRPLTRLYARDRIARMICADRDTFTDIDAHEAARFVWNCQSETIGNALRKVIGTLPVPPNSILLSGSGEKLAEAAIFSADSKSTILRLSELLGVETSAVAPAYAVAVLVSEECDEL